MASLAPAIKSAAYSCHRDDTVFAAVEKCLDNGLDACFVVDDRQKLLGQVTLDELRGSIMDGTAFCGASVGRYMAARMVDGRPGNERAAGELPAELEVAIPVLDAAGRLIDVVVDRSKKFIHVARPSLTHQELRGLLDAFLSSWISSRGQCVQSFEREFAALIDVPHGIAVSNGTAALHLALLALGVGPGDEVIVPDLTFAATINAVLFCGATPVIVDVDPITWSMNVGDAERAFTPRTKAILPVHLYGHPAEIGPIVEFARSRGCHVVEDCAEAHGARYAGQPVGRFGDVSCFSFYANKIVTTGEGGICVTGSAALRDIIVQLRDHGVGHGRFYWHERVGYNYHLTNLQSAIGIAQIKRIDRILDRNRRLDALYREYLGDIDGVIFPPDLPEQYEPVTWLVCAQVPAAQRTSLIEEALRNDIELRPFFHSLSAMPPYRSFARSCPVSIAVSAAGINLPTSSDVDEHVVRKIERLFRRVLR